MRIIKSNKAVTNSDIEFLAETAANVTTDKELNDVLSSLKLVDEKLWREMCDAYDSGEYSPAYIGKDISDILILEYLPRDVESCDKVSSSVTYPNGVEVSDIDLDTYLDYNFGEDRDRDNSKYTDEEKQRAVNYWFAKQDIYDRPLKYKKSAYEYDVNKVESSTDFDDWYDSLTDSQQSTIDDIADEEGIPLYSDASESDLAYLIDRGQSIFSSQDTDDEVSDDEIKEVGQEYSSKGTAVSSSTAIYGSSSNIENEVYDAAIDVMLSPEFGFDPDEVVDYLFVESKQVGGSTVVELRAEVSYDGLEKLCDACNPIVQKYDPSSYFEPVEPGIAQAWIGDAYVQSSKYGGAFDIDDEEFFTRDEINEWGYAVVDKFNETMKTSFVLESVYCESSSLELNITDYDYTLSTTVKVDMRRIRRSSDINKYIDIAVTSLIQEYKDNVEG